MSDSFEETTNFFNVKRLPSNNSDNFVLTSKIPNGTNVTVQDAPQIEYIWMDGKVVPKTDERMLAIARQGHKFIPGKEEPRFWLMAIGILVVLIAGGIHLRRYLKSED